MSPEQAQAIAREWIDAWNSRDLAHILSHYTDDLEFSSPFIVDLAGEPSGTLRGKAAVAGYWEKALARTPDLHFELMNVLAGVASVTVYYHRVMQGRNGAEVLFVNDEGRIYKGIAHYDA